MMCKLNNRDTLYAVVRCERYRSVVCAFTNTLEHADDLRGEYEQQWLDAGGPPATTFEIQANTFYAA